MKPSRITKARLRIVATGSLTAVLLAFAAFSGASADAADGRPTRAQASRVDRSALPMSPRGVIERRELTVEHRIAPQPAGNTTVVLRGSRSPAYPNLTGPNLTGPGLNGAGYGSSRAVGPVLQPGAGWDRELDYGGLDYGGSTPLVITNP